MPPGPERPLFGKASKKPLNSEQVLVSRKAMQNYNRFLEQANIFTTFFQKKAVFLIFAWFRTPQWRFRTAAGAMLPGFSTWRPTVSIAVVQQCTEPEGMAGKPTGGKAPEGKERHPRGRKGTRWEAHAQPAGGLRAASLKRMELALARVYI